VTGLVKAAYEQNYQHFRSLNQIMWQIPVLATTLTGGLWFGVTKIEEDQLACALLVTASLVNCALIVVLRRFRYVMQKYLDWLKAAYPDGFVDASSPSEKDSWLTKWMVANERVRQMFSLMLMWAAGVSLWLAIDYYPQRDGASQMTGDLAMQFYEQHAESLADLYESISFEAVYPYLVAKLSGESLGVLDIGAGTGRDAAWIAARGHQVHAVEPSAAMRRIARRLHPSSKIIWIDARLPDLEASIIQPATYDVVLAHAVWMHVSPEVRQRALARIYEITKDTGMVSVSLRLGPVDEERGMFEISEHVFLREAESIGFQVRRQGEFADLLGRASVSWKVYLLEKNGVNSIEPTDG